MGFMKQCSQCGKKGLFLSLDENGLCGDCRIQNEQAQLEKEKAAKKAQAQVFYDSLASLYKTVMPDTASCSFEDVRLAIDMYEQFKSEVAHIPSIPYFVDCFRNRCSTIGSIIVVSEDFDTLKISSEGAIDFVEILDRVETKRAELLNLITASDKFNADLIELPKAEITVDPSADPYKTVLSNTLPLKTSNITQRTSRSKLNTFFVIDVETTGLNPMSDEIIQLTAIKYLGFYPVEAFSTYIKPHHGLKERAQKVNGITEENVADAPYIEHVMQSFIDFIGMDSPIVGHNLSFDFNFLVLNGCTSLLLNRKFFDTLELSKREFSSLSKFSLDYICRKKLSLIRTNSHDALSDAMATGRLFQCICDSRIAK